MGDYAGNIVKHQEKTKEKQQFTLKRQTTQNFSNTMMPEQVLQQNIQRVNTVEFSGLNFEEFAQKNMPDLLIQEQNFDMLNTSKVNLEQSNQKDEAAERLEKQPKELRENYTALLTLMKEVKESCQRESGTGNSELMNNVISQVTSFETYINSKEFNLSNPVDCMRRFIDMRNTISIYYEKNKGYKWTSKGARRRDLTKSILERLNGWVGNLPKGTIEADVAREMLLVDNLKNLLATMRDKKYGTSDDAGTWFPIQRAGESFFSNLDKKTDEQAGAELASLLKSAQGYIGTHAGKRRTQKGRDRVEFAQNIVSSISNILKNGTFGTRIATFDSIIENRHIENRPGDAAANELMGNFLTQYAVDALHAEYGNKTGAEGYMTEKTAIYMHNRDKFFSHQHSIRYLTKGEIENSIFRRGNCENNISKSFRLNRYGKVEPKYANDAKLAELSVNRALKADPSDAPYISRSAFVKQLEQIKITPEMCTKEYLDSHYVEMKRMIISIGNLEHAFKNWTGECKETSSKEYNSYPPEIDVKVKRLSSWASNVGQYYTYTEMLSGFGFHKGISIGTIPDIEMIKQAGIPEEMDKKTDQEEKRKYMSEKDAEGYTMQHMYEDVEVSKGKFEVRDAAGAQLIKAKRLYEENDINFTEEDIKAVRYFAYQEEAKAETKRLGLDITPEAVAFRKMRLLVRDYSKEQGNTPESKAVSKVYTEGMFNRAYMQRLRYVNYNKDGQPATKEDQKNQEWNKAYARSIAENKQEDRIRLIKENCEYVADLINQVDFDRLLDFDYWLNNKDLYITLNNFGLTGMDLQSNSVQKEDEPILREYFSQKTPMMNLLHDFTKALAAMQVYMGAPTMALKVSEQGEYSKDKDKNNNEQSMKMMQEISRNQTMEHLAKVKNSLTVYNASKI